MESCADFFATVSFQVVLSTENCKMNASPSKAKVGRWLWSSSRNGTKIQDSQGLFLNLESMRLPG